MESTIDTEPSIGKALVLGLSRISVILGSTLALSYALGAFFARRASSFKFVSDTLTNWPGPHDWTLVSFIGLQAAFFGVVFLALVGVLLALLTAMILEVGGKEVFPRW